MSLALISVALPMATFSSGMGTMVGSLSLEKANLGCKHTVVRQIVIVVSNKCHYNNYKEKAKNMKL